MNLNVAALALAGAGVIYIMSNSKPRNVRNNNPLNIKATGDQWQGMAGTDGTFVKFKNPAYGFRAAYKILTRYMDSYGLNTIQRIVNRWAPEHDDNPVDSYVEYLAGKLQLSPADPLDADDLPGLMLHMADFEGAKGAFNYDQVMQGVALA